MREPRQPFLSPHKLRPRQSYPVQKGLFKLPVNDPLTQYLRDAAESERWEYWDHAWAYMNYLPRWDLTEIWKGPPGWQTPHAFLNWATWHMATAHGWLSRLQRHMRRSHSPEALLSDVRPIPTIYMFLNKQQVDRARSDTFKAMRILGAGSPFYLPTPEVVKYPPNGLTDFMQFIEADHNLGESITNFEWHESRARHKAEFFVREMPGILNVSSKLLKRHLGESGWSE